MRIGVISDTHIPERAKSLPRQVLADLKNVDMVIHAGDWTDIAVWESIHKVCTDVRGVCGNMDSTEIAKKFPQKQILTVGNFRLGLMHGWGAPNKIIDLLQESFKNDKPNMIIFGHSHIPLHTVRSECIFFNPGSPTDTVFAPYLSYGIIEITDKIETKIIKI